MCVVVAPRKRIYKDFLYKITNISVPHCTTYPILLTFLCFSSSRGLLCASQSICGSPIEVQRGRGSNLREFIGFALRSLAFCFGLASHRRFMADSKWRRTYQSTFPSKSLQRYIFCRLNPLQTSADIRHVTRKVGPVQKKK